MNQFRNLAVLLGLAVLTLFADAAAQDRGRGRGRESTPTELEHLVYQRRSFESPALGGRRADYGVFVPKDLAASLEAAASDGDGEGERADGDGAAEPAKRYPLVVFLHGMFEDRDRFLERGGAPVLDRLTGDDTFPEAIFVCADGDRSSFWIDAVAEGNDYEKLVIEDLIADVEKHYPVAKEREQRALLGVSMGGYGALKIAFRHPQKFGIVAAHSAAILPEDPDVLEERYGWLRGRGRQMLSALFGDPVDAKKWRDENVLTLSKNADAERLDGLKIYFDCGDEDRYGFEDANQELHEILERKEIAHTWQLVEGGNHGWRSGYNQGQLPASLRFVASQLAVRRGVSGLGGLLGGDRRK